MLTQLTIKNFGLIDEVTCAFDARLNILTGETGAGKSIIIDALRICLGERLPAAAVRDAAKLTLIEAVFDLAQTRMKDQELFADFLQDSDELIIARSISSEGKARNKINGLTVTVAQLKQVGNYLIDFHGAHDHQLLLSSDAHLGMLDRLVDFGPLMETYLQDFNSYEKLVRELTTIEGQSQTRERTCDLLAHQIKELEQVPLNDDHYQELLARQHRIDNAEKIHIQLGQLLNLLESDEVGIDAVISKTFSPMRALNEADPESRVWMEKLETLEQAQADLLSDLHDYAASLTFEPSEAEEVNTLCDLYDDIKRKYGPSLEEACLFYQDAKQQYDRLANWEQNTADLKTRIDNALTALKQKAKKITAKRKKGAALLEYTIKKELKELGIQHVDFECRFEKFETPTRLGAERVVFYISPNAGEVLKPLSEIVSSGEAARVMLALKKALIKVDPVLVLIFDEIDAQIGGRLGTITGRKLKEIAQARQVILITHLAQIASFADCHFKVKKVVKAKRTITELLLLDDEHRISELAKMMSGEKESAIATQHAQDLLVKASA